MPLYVKDLSWEVSSQTVYDLQYTIRIPLTGSSNPTSADIMARFLAAYPQWVDDLLGYWNWLGGDRAVIRHDDGAGYSYWEFKFDEHRITSITHNGVALTEFKEGTTIVWTKYLASFDGLTGATPSSYSSQYYLDDETVVSPGSPTKAGYSFNGWYSTGIGEDLPFGPLTENATFTAQWLQYPAVPTLTFYAANTTFITWTITNNSNFAVRVYYDVNDTTPDFGYVDLAANASAQRSVTGLNPGTSYTGYARAYANGLYSANDTDVQSTLGSSTWAYEFLGAGTDLQGYEDEWFGNCPSNLQNYNDIVDWMETYSPASSNQGLIVGCYSSYFDETILAESVQQ